MRPCTYNILQLQLTSNSLLFHNLHIHKVILTFSVPNNLHVRRTFLGERPRDVTCTRKNASPATTWFFYCAISTTTWKFAILPHRPNDVHVRNQILPHRPNDVHVRNQIRTPATKRRTAFTSLTRFIYAFLCVGYLWSLNEE